jgi:integrase
LRIGELAGVRREHVSLESRPIHLPTTKNGHPRPVPFSSRAVEALRCLPQKVKGRLFAAMPDSSPESFGIGWREGGKH